MSAGFPPCHVMDASPRALRCTPCAVLSTALSTAAVALLLAYPATARADEPQAAPTATNAAPAPEATPSIGASPAPAPQTTPSMASTETPAPQTTLPITPYPYAALAGKASLSAEDLEDQIERARDHLPVEVTQSPEYISARKNRIAGIVSLSVGAGGVFFGGAFLASTAFRPGGGSAEEGYAVAGGVALGVGAALMAAGSVLVFLGNRERHKIEDEHLKTLFPSLQMNIGLGSVSFSGAF